MVDKVLRLLRTKNGFCSRLETDGTLFEEN